MVKLECFSKNYGTFFAARDISFCAGEGTITGLLGPNGSGKTTILKAIAAIHFAASGNVFVEEFDAAREPLKARAVLGYAAENAHLIPNWTVRETLSFAARVHGVQKSEIDSVEATLFLGDVMDTLCSRLSKGYAQRVSLALALLHNPKVLVLDEPASGLDPAQIHELRGLLKSLSKTKTIILSTHLIHEAESLCSHIHIIQNGKLLASGSKEEILERAGENNLEKAYLALCERGAS